MKTSRHLEKIGIWLCTWGVIHLAATVGLSIVMTAVLAPSKMTLYALEQVWKVPELWEGSATRLLLHFGLSACVWAIFSLTFMMLAQSWKRRKTTVFQLQRGTVLTETIIILPVWMLLVFGLAQLSVNNIAGVLGNVAIYEAARTAWVWEGEVGNRAGVTSEIVNEKVKIAAALVMTPVSPGGFVGNPLLSDRPGKMRTALAMTHVPLVGGAISQALPSDVQSLLGTAASLDFTIPTRNNQSVRRALDGELFIIRTVKKFTHAFHATKVTVNGSSVTLEYRHFIAMPMMGPVFGQKTGILAAAMDTSGTMRPGYYTTVTRTSSRLSQSMNPANSALPSNAFQSAPTGSQGVNTGNIQNGAGGSW